MSSLSDLQHNWDSISSDLDQALELTEPDLAAWLERIAAQDAPRAGRIRELLSLRRRAGFPRFLEDSPALPIGTFSASLTGRTVGAYIVDDEVGRGGMGSVWRAHRADGRYEGTVAIKVVHAYWIGQAGAERFRVEGELLARLHHPNIARLLDAGVIDGTQPYLVLEYVEGEPIDSFCDQRSLGLEARVRLFLDVLAAVGHAHSHLIVHRDLKPSNVFVTADGVVKLLDFGVAKLLEGDAGSAAVTRSAAVALTPQYAAPEQLLGGSITTATDVYALGLVLYVMLVGLHPLAREARTAADFVRAASTEGRPRASVLAAPRASDGALARDAALRAAHRGTSVRQLSQALAGDLDNILARALAVAPAERYASASDMAADLRRFLSHEPVQAHAPSWRYRLTKLLRRRPLESALVAVALVAVTAGFAATFWQWRIAEAQRGIAIEQRERAERMLARTVAANDFSDSLLTEFAQVSHPVRFSDIIERGEKLAMNNGGDAAQRAQALLSLAGVYDAANNGAKGEELTKRAAELALQAGDRPLAAIAECMQGFALAAQGRHAAGVALQAQGLVLAGDDPEAGYRCYEERAHTEQILDHGPQTAELGRKALEIANRYRWLSPAARAALLDVIGDGNLVSRNFAEAETYFQQALDLQSKAGLSESLGASAILDHIGDLRARQGQTRAATEAKEHAFKIQLAIAGEDGIAVALYNNLARLLLKLHRLDEAADLANRGRERGAQTHDEVSVFAANITLAGVRLEQRRFQEAQQLIDEARRHVGDESPGSSIASMLSYRQSQLLVTEGRPAEAIPALDAWQAELEANAQRTGSRNVIGTFATVMAMTRAQALADTGHLREGIASAEEAVALSRKAQGEAPVSSDTGLALLLLAELSVKASGPRSVAEIAREADRNLAESLGPDHPKSVRAHELLVAAGG